MELKKLSSLEQAKELSSDDIIVIQDGSDGKPKYITISQLSTLIKE